LNLAILYCLVIWSPISVVASVNFLEVI
jgi:hypothetical protein